MTGSLERPVNKQISIYRAQSNRCHAGDEKVIRHQVYPERPDMFSKDQKIMRCEEARSERLSFTGSRSNE